MPRYQFSSRCFALAADRATLPQSPPTGPDRARHLDAYGDSSISPLAVDDSTLVAVMGDGLSIVDVSDLRRPVVRGRIDPYGTDPTSPAVVATSASPSTASTRGSLAILDEKAYFADPAQAPSLTDASAATMPLGSGTAMSGISADCIAGAAPDLLVCADGSARALMHPTGNDLSLVRSIQTAGHPESVRVFNKLGLVTTSPVFGTDGLGNPVLATPARLALFLID